MGGFLVPEQKTFFTKMDYRSRKDEGYFFNWPFFLQ